jgi:nucleoid-associated protein YgaU
MNKKSLVKQLGIAVLALGVAVGCSSTPEPVEQPAEEQMVGMSEDARAAIAEAKAAAKRASAMGCAWRDTNKLIEEAEAEGNAGKNFRAIVLAKKATKQAEDAIRQCEEERAKVDQSEADKGVTSYTVVGGDSLWGISSMDSIYADPYQWPLIYKANSGAIKDADLIYPGQVFSIDRGASAADVDAAINHAKTRGAWSVGTVEASDEAYLAQ